MKNTMYVKTFAALALFAGSSVLAMGQVPQKDANARKISVNVSGSIEQENGKLQGNIAKLISDSREYKLVIRSDDAVAALEKEHIFQQTKGVKDADVRDATNKSGSDLMLIVKINIGSVSASLAEVETFEAIGYETFDDVSDYRELAYRIADKVLHIPDIYKKWEEEQKADARRREEQQRLAAQAEIDQAYIDAQAKAHKDNLEKEERLRQIKADADKKAAEEAAQKKIEAEKKREVAESRLFLMYRGSPSGLGGLMFGGARYAGAYVQVHTSSAGINAAQLDLFHENYTGTAKKELYRRSITGGVLVRLATNHLHLFVGGGYGCQGNVYKENRGRKDKQGTAIDDYIAPPATWQDGIEVEAGAILSLWRISLSAGYSVMGTGFNPLEKQFGEVTFGIGINW